jgi:long-chain acyl-CoA synthetase
MIEFRKVKGRSLPEAFFLKAKELPDYEVYFTKKNGGWVPQTYSEMLATVLKSVAGLQALGFKRGEKIAILAENREEWILTDYAAQWLGGATAAIYATSTADQIQYILNESEASVLFVSNKALLKRLEGLTSLTHLKAIVAYDAIDNPSTPASIKFVSKEEFLKSALPEQEAVKLLDSVQPHDLCILLYTSGTTGEPKGVMLTHYNLLSNIEMMLRAIPIRHGLVTISFLPLSHIYERSLHNLMLIAGLKVYFAESVEKVLENIQEVRPQLMTAVPRIFEKMYSKINEKIRGASSLQKKIFFAAQYVGQRTFQYRYERKSLPTTWAALYGLFDLLVFRKLRAVTGGRAELFISGGAPLSKDIAEFFFRAGFKILEGYGLSETCILSVNRVERFRFGTVGHPFEHTEIKIAEDGEICVRGPQVMQGYYKRPDATAEVFDDEGWFKTGDIGEIDSQGFIRITDRKKELIATAGGKKIAPQPVENFLKSDPLVESACLVGDRRKYITVLLVPNLEMVRSWGSRRGLSLSSLSECVESEALQGHFSSLVQSANKDLPQYSTIKDFRILDKPFAVETGELTPTLKLKRRVIQERYAAVIDSMYPQEEEKLVI